MKCVRWIASIRAWICKRSNYIQELDNRSRPTMGQNERQRIRFGRTDMQEMNIRSIDCCCELWQFIQK